MSDDLDALLTMAKVIAKARYDGHLTIMKFTTTWRVGFGTVSDRLEGEGENIHRPEIEAMSCGVSLCKALNVAVVAELRKL